MGACGRAAAVRALPPPLAADPFRLLGIVSRAGRRPLPPSMKALGLYPARRRPPLFLGRLLVTVCCCPPVSPTAALIRASAVGDLPALSYELSWGWLKGGADPDFLDPEEGVRALHVAASKEVTQKLLEGGAAIDATDLHGLTPLHVHAAQGVEKLAIVEALLAARAGAVDVAGPGGWRALHACATAGHTEVLSALIRHGANPNSQIKDRRTALHLAAENGHAAVVSALLAGGAAVDARAGAKEWTALHTAASGGHAEVT
jgi:hypothetical protein